MSEKNAETQDALIAEIQNAFLDNGFIIEEKIFRKDINILSRTSIKIIIPETGFTINTAPFDDRLAAYRCALLLSIKTKP